MAVYQVEQYYVHMCDLSITDDQKAAIDDYLSDEGWTNYEFQENNTTLIIDDIEEEGHGDTLEAAINNIIR